MRSTVMVASSFCIVPLEFTSDTTKLFARPVSWLLDRSIFRVVSPTATRSSRYVVKSTNMLPETRIFDSGNSLRSNLETVCSSSNKYTNSTTSSSFSLMDTSVGLTPSKLSLSEASVSVEVFVEPSVTADVSFEPPVSIRKLFDAPPSLEPPHADKSTEIESTLAEKIIRVISSYPFLNQLNYFRALAYLCQYLIAYWCITRHFS